MPVFNRIPKRFFPCTDGTYSDHKRRGACNYHGGLKTDGSVVNVSRGKKGTSAHQAAEVVLVPINQINVRKEWFQGRTAAFSSRSVDNIVDAVQAGRFLWVNLDPLTLWAAPDGKLYVLSGHSRFEAFNQLCKANAQAQGRGFCSIPAKIEANISLSQAKEIALQSNTLSTKETVLERAAYYARLRSAGTDENTIQATAKRLEGKNYTSVIAYSYLDPNGKTYAALSALDKGSNDSSNIITSVARWIGNARRTYPLSNYHEGELYDWLINNRGYGTGRSQVSNERDFKERLNSIINRRTTFGRLEDTLNIQAHLQRSPVEQQYDEQLNNAKKAVTEAETALKAKIRELTGRNATEAQIQQITEGLEATLRRSRIRYQELLSKRGEVSAAARNELSLFAALSGKQRLTHGELLQFIDTICSPQCFSATMDDCECKCQGKYHAASEDPQAYNRLIKDLRSLISVASVGAIVDTRPPGRTMCLDKTYSTYPHGRGVCSYHGGSTETQGRKKPVGVDRFPGAKKQKQAEAQTVIPEYCHGNFSELKTFEFIKDGLKRNNVDFNYKTVRANTGRSIVLWEITTDVKLYDEYGRNDDVLRLWVMNGGGEKAINIMGTPSTTFRCSEAPEAITYFVDQYRSFKSSPGPKYQLNKRDLDYTELSSLLKNHLTKYFPGVRVYVDKGATSNYLVVNHNDFATLQRIGKMFFERCTDKSSYSQNKFLRISVHSPIYLGKNEVSNILFCEGLVKDTPPLNYKSKALQKLHNEGVIGPPEELTTVGKKVAQLRRKLADAEQKRTVIIRNGRKSGSAGSFNRSVDNINHTISEIKAEIEKLDQTPNLPAPSTSSTNLTNLQKAALAVMQKETGKDWYFDDVALRPVAGRVQPSDKDVIRRVFDYYGKTRPLGIRDSWINLTTWEWPDVINYYEKPPFSPNNVYVQTVSYQQAYDAHRGTSQSPERRAKQHIESEKEYLVSQYQELAKGRTPEQIQLLNASWNNYVNKRVKKQQELMNTRSGIVSVLVTGGSNFPTRRNQKRNDILHRKQGSFYEWEEKYLKAIRKDRDIYPELAQYDAVKHGDDGALEALREKYNKLVQHHERMKAINKAIRSKKDVEQKLRDLGLSEKHIKEIQEPDYMGRTGFASYQLTNSNANIKRLRDRITQEEKIQATRASGPRSVDFDGGTVEEALNDNRLRIFFDDKPELAMRQTLKGSGWRWSPRAVAWQRQLTDNAWHSAARILSISDPTRTKNISGIIHRRNKLISI